MEVVGHRANTVRWLRRHLACTRSVEVDVYLRGGVPVAGHLLPRARPLLLRERLARLLEGLHFTPSRPLRELLAHVPPGSLVMLDLKDRVPPRLLADSLEEAGGLELVLVTRWHSDARALAEALPGARVLLSIDSRPAEPRALVEAAGAHGVSVRASYIDHGLVEALHQGGYLVAAWTVNEPREALRLAELGVDMIVSDVPCEIARALRAGRSSQARPPGG